MKYNVKENLFVNNTGDTIKYKYCAIDVNLNGLPFEVKFKEIDKDKTGKKLIIEESANADFQLRLVSTNKGSFYKPYVVVNGLDVPVYMTPAEIYILQVVNASKK